MSEQTAASVVFVLRSADRKMPTSCCSSTLSQRALKHFAPHKPRPLVEVRVRRSIHARAATHAPQRHFVNTNTNQRWTALRPLLPGDVRQRFPPPLNTNRSIGKLVSGRESLAGLPMRPRVCKSPKPDDHNFMIAR